MALAVAGPLIWVMLSSSSLPLCHSLFFGAKNFLWIEGGYVVFFARQRYKNSNELSIYIYIYK
jgi:hypothetical protein